MEAQLVLTDEEVIAEAIAAEREADESESDARWRAADAYAELSRRGWSTREIGKRVGRSHSHIVFCIKAAGYPGNRSVFQEAYREAQGKNIHFSSDSPEWATPQELFDLLDAEFVFTTDVCATDENAKCAYYFTEEDDGLSQPWVGVCWMNPPYGREIAAWVEKAHRSGEEGAIVVCLVPARTDTDWWWQHCRFGEIRFLHGRLRFNDAETGAPFPSAVIIFGRGQSMEHWEEWAN